MPLTVPPELKKITPYVRRAEELDRDKTIPESRLVAYYCRQYAVHVGIPLAKSAEAKQCLGTLLGDLEGEKAAMSNFTRDESKYLCRAFADKIFDKADLQDRMGEATKITARTFYAAATFYEVLQQFYAEDEVSDEWEEEKKRTVYAKWKATDILKAIREGREPTSGGYGEDAGEGEESEKEEEQGIPEAPTGEPKESELTSVLPPPVETVEEGEDESVADEENETEDAGDQGTEVELFGPPPAYPGELPQPDDHPPPSVDRPPVVFKPPMPSAVKPPPPEEASPKKTGIFGIGKKKSTKPAAKVSKADLADAVELTRFALTALEGKDVELGATRLKQALEALGR